MTDTSSGTSRPDATARTNGVSRWAFALVGVLAAGLAPLAGFRLAMEQPGRAADGALLTAGLLVAALILAGPLVGGFLLTGTWRLRLLLAGVLVVGLAGAYLVSQHRPDSAASPPPSDWIVPYGWLGSLLSGGVAIVQRIRMVQRQPSRARTAAGVAMLAFAVLYSGCLGYLVAMHDLNSSRLAARPNQSEIAIPPGWTERQWLRIEEGDVGFVSDLQPPTGVDRDEAIRRLAAYLCEQRGWCMRCRPVRGILPWGRHCLTITTTPTDPALVRVAVVKEGATVPA
jgi:hypothetical protein